MEYERLLYDDDGIVGIPGIFINHRYIDIDIASGSKRKKNMVKDSNPEGRPDSRKVFQQVCMI